MNEIDNCPMVLSWECPMVWEELRQTDNPHVRSCLSCRKQVFVCRTLNEFASHAAAGHCVAISDPARGQRLVTGRPGGVRESDIEL